MAHWNKQMRQFWPEAEAQDLSTLVTHLHAYERDLVLEEDYEGPRMKQLAMIICEMLRAQPKLVVAEALMWQ